MIFIVWAILLVLVVLIGWRFAQYRHRNYSPPSHVEKPLSSREALRFGIDNNLLDRSQTVHYIQPRKGEPLERYYTEGPNKGYPKDVY